MIEDKAAWLLVALTGERPRILFPPKARVFPLTSRAV
jgi:hypothetical protein